MKERKQTVIQKRHRFMLGLLGIVSFFPITFAKASFSTESAPTHLGTFQGGTVFETTSSNGVNPGLFLEVMDKDGNLTQYESEEGKLILPDTQEGAYITQAKLLGKTHYLDEQTGEILTQWEADRSLQLISSEAPTLKTYGEVTATYPSTNVYKDSIRVASSKFHTWDSWNGRYYQIPEETKGIKLSFKRLLEEAQNKGYIRIFLTVVDSDQAKTVVSSDQLLGINYYWPLNAETYEFNATWDIDLSDYAGKFLVVSFRDHQLKSDKDFELQVAALTSLDHLSDYEMSFQKESTIQMNETPILRGIGMVRDELNLVNGEIKQRINELTLDGTESWGWVPEAFQPSDKNFILFNSPKNDVKTSGALKANRLPVRNPAIPSPEITFSSIGTHSTQKEFRLCLEKQLVPSLTELENWIKQHPIQVQYQLDSPQQRQIELRSNYFFSPLYKEYVQINGTVEPTLATITVPSVPLTFVLDPNQPRQQQFISPDFSITNQANAPLQLQLKTFKQTTSVMSDVLPSAVEDWEELNQKDSRQIALALVPVTSESWFSLKEGERYVANTTNEKIGVIKPKQTVEFQFVAKHGQAFGEQITPSYQLLFVFEFVN